MIHIAVCDDCEADADKTGYLLEKYAERTDEYDLEIHKFTNPYTLLSRLEAGERYNLFLLDIIMPLINGIELGKKIRSLDENALIIFETCSKEFAVDSFCVNPFNYIVKPLDEEQVTQVLGKALRLIQDQDSSIFPVKTKKGIITVRIHRIVFVEYVKHHIVLHLSDGTVISSNQFRESFDGMMAPLLSTKYFIKTHKAFVVNIKHVKVLNHNKYFEVTDGIVPIAASMYTKVKKYYMKYISEEVNRRYRHSGFQENPATGLSEKKLL